MSAIHLPYTHGCFVCGVDNPHGLQLRFRAEHGEVRADFPPQAQHAGYTGMVHGGIIAAALDETMFWAVAYARKQFYVSVELNIRYLKKVEVGQQYRLIARLVREQKKFCVTEGALHNADGETCATATGRYFPMRPEDVPLRVEDFFADPQTFSPVEFFAKPR